MCKQFYQRYTCTYRDSKGLLHHIANSKVEHCERYDRETRGCPAFLEEIPSPPEDSPPLGECPECRRREAKADRDKKRAEEDRRKAQKLSERRRQKYTNLCRR
jgi:hypothetical protein